MKSFINQNLNKQVIIIIIILTTFSQLIKFYFFLEYSAWHIPTVINYQGGFVRKLIGKFYIKYINYC